MASLSGGGGGSGSAGGDTRSSNGGISGVGAVTSSSENCIPPELRIDLTELIGELMNLHYTELVSGSTPTGTGALTAAATLHSSGGGTPNSTSGASGECASAGQPVVQIRTALARALEATRRLRGCDLDLEAQKKLLVAVATACVAKRQLLCQLKHDLQNLSDSEEVEHLFSGSLAPQQQAGVPTGGLGRPMSVNLTPSKTPSSG